MQCYPGATLLKVHIPFPFLAQPAIPSPFALYYFYQSSNSRSSERLRLKRPSVCSLPGFADAASPATPLHAHVVA